MPPLAGYGVNGHSLLVNLLVCCAANTPVGMCYSLTVSCACALPLLQDDKRVGECMDVWGGCMLVAHPLGRGTCSAGGLCCRSGLVLC
jgi:hypothetical protein